MTQSATVVNSTVPSEMHEFYTIAQNIRNRNNKFELPWSETKDIEQFLEKENVEGHLLIVRSDAGEGRVLAYRFSDKPETGFIGWYEADDSEKVAEQLLTEAELWLKSLGVKTVFGPMNGSSWGTFRFNLDSDKPLFATEPYQPLYYPKHWETAGFKNDVVYETHLVPKDISRPMSEKEVHGLAAMVGVKFSTWPVNFTENEQQLMDMHAFFHSCFKDNPLYQPITFETYKKITKKLEKIIDYDHSFVVWDKDDKPVSVLISYKDVYNAMFEAGQLKDKSHDTYTLYMKTICTAPEWRGKHLSRVLVNYGFNVAFDSGYKEVVFGTMMMDNSSAQYSKSFFDAKALRTYGFMKKSL